MEHFPIEYWAITQIMIDLVLLVLVLYLYHHLGFMLNKNVYQQASKQVIRMIEPLVKEADAIANTFEKQLGEKHRLIQNLNESLDRRIISLNLLMNRAELHLKAGEIDANGDSLHVYDQQEAIIDLFQKGHTAESIARKLSLPRGEIDLVLDLKKKLLAMS